MKTDDNNMKIMYVDISTEGHHLIYLNSLLQNVSSESFAALPVSAQNIQGRVRTFPSPAIRTVSGYKAWIRDLKKIVSEEKPDLIHFLDGDSIMRYFGLGLSNFKACKIVITFHHLFSGKLREISMRNMLRQANAGVFHTDIIKQRVRSFGCKNVWCIPYPCFLDVDMCQGSCKRHEVPVLLALGGTRHDKGLDILLEALKSVKEPFRLVIAGKEEQFNRDYIERKIQSYESSVELQLRFLSEQEVLSYMCNSDIIVLPYRKEFDGASGPMCEGIYLGKAIIGPDHGSLGKLIRQCHVGYTFESESVSSLAECLNQALAETFVYDVTAKEEQKKLKPEAFIEKYLELYDTLL